MQILKIAGLLVFIFGMVVILVRMLWWALDIGDYFQDKE